MDSNARGDAREHVLVVTATNNPGALDGDLK